MEYLFKSAMENTKNERELRKSFSTSDEELFGRARILVVGSGGGGNNTVHRLANMGVEGCELIAMNTDKQHLDMIRADKKLLLGAKLTRGLGAGGYPEKGRQAAIESKDKVAELLEGADLVFLTAGLGGGTGTGSLPVIAEIAKDNGAIVVGAVTLPFRLERVRMQKAREGLMKLRDVADSVVVVDNNKLVSYVPDLGVEEAFGVADEILARMVKGISETIATPSLVNIDFADIKAVFSENQGRGVAMIGLGEAEGRDRAEEAVRRALEHPLLDVDYRGATGALIHITGGRDLSIAEANEIGEIATSYIRDSGNVIWGARVDPAFDKRVQVMVIVTGVTSPDILGPNSPAYYPKTPQHLRREIYGIEKLSRIRANSPSTRVPGQRFVNNSPFTGKKSVMDDLDIDYII